MKVCELVLPLALDVQANHLKAGVYVSEFGLTIRVVGLVDYVHYTKTELAVQKL